MPAKNNGINFDFFVLLKLAEKSDVSFKIKQNLASAGNRTRAARVAGEHSTTEPPMPAKDNGINFDFFVLLKLAEKSDVSFKIKRNLASAGNRTRAASVAGKHCTTEPPMLAKYNGTNFVFFVLLKLAEKSDVSFKIKQNLASAGNRTLAARMAGEHSTTEPPMPAKNNGINFDFFVLLRVAAKADVSIKIKQNLASAGNRTRAARVAGEHSTTEPPMLAKYNGINFDFFVLLRVAAKAEISIIIKLPLASARNRTRAAHVTGEHSTTEAPMLAKYNLWKWRSLSAHVGTRKMVNYARTRRSQRKLWWRSVAVLTCKSIVRSGSSGVRLIEPSSSWFPPKFPSG
ncbi:hypothetical protein JTE90_002231 [Oedothorax gibbosus]|uniref:Uncharacterized protein n=1 Tax=Oedothorax gibbosus TaxID=931172 RepID=A0AAV6TRT7_9ARAC|nr:hypothetical protein JTE90_002231 [Oedothorax gibbosus]